MCDRAGVVTKGEEAVEPNGERREFGCGHVDSIGCIKYVNASEGQIANVYEWGITYTTPRESEKNPIEMLFGKLD